MYYHIVKYVITYNVSLNYTTLQLVITHFFILIDMDCSDVSFKERLNMEITYHGFSKKEFAEKAGISIGTLNMYLYRDSIPAADVAVRIAEILNVTVEFLITGKSNSSKTKFSQQKNEIYTIVESFNDKQLLYFLDIARAYKNSTENN